MDTYDNCIPLCFDCHADVGNYNSKHPKGNKYSSNELKLHRDKWYKSVESGLVPSAPNDHLELDKGLFKKLCLILKGSEFMLHFRRHDYSEMFHQKFPEAIDDLVHASNLPETEFYNVFVSTAFQSLIRSCEEYRDESVNRIWFESNDLAGIPREWISDDPHRKNEKRFWDSAEIMNKKAAAIWDAYDSFVRAARFYLCIEIEQIS